MFDLKIPCVSCPFRVGVGQNFQLHPDRLEEIFTGDAFQCHNTVEYGEGEPQAGDRPQQCAGAMAVLWRERSPNTIMRLAIATGYLDPDELDPNNEAYKTFDEVMEAHGAKK